jgi:demethylmacrocin O-methyltransferase
VSAEPPSLDSLALRYGADKSSKVHGYTRAYERHFAPFRQSPVVLLEIGIGGGASLRTWRDYFPRGKVFGLDVADCKPLEAHGVWTFQGSQADEDVLERLLFRTGPLDVVIDDGSHRWSDQIASFRKLYPHVTPGGYYVVEDLHTSYWDQYRSGDQSMAMFLCDMVHELNLHGRSGYGAVANDPEYPSYRGELNVYQRTVDEICFYKSIAFVRKKTAGEISP